MPDNVAFHTGRKITNGNHKNLDCLFNPT